MIETGSNADPGWALGFILGDALKASPPVPTLSDDDAQVIAAQSLASMIADFLHVHFDDVWDVLIHLNNQMLPLLNSPSGWAALLAVVAGQLGVAVSARLPIIH